jgi:hypothetical protein
MTPLVSLGHVDDIGHDSTLRAEASPAAESRDDLV